MHYDINRRPLFETVKKHATSGNFLAVIICNLISLGASCLLFGTVFSVLIDLSELFSSPLSGINSYFFFAVFGILGLIFIATIVVSLLLTLKLLSVRRFFKGKNNNPNGLSAIIKLQKIYYILGGIASVVSVLSAIIFMFSSFIPEEEASAIITLLFFVLPIYLAEIGGMIVLYYFSFKSIKTTVNYAINAVNDTAEGKVSVFLQVLSIIGIVSAASLVLSSIFIFVIAFIFFTLLTMQDTIFLSVFFSVMFLPFALLLKSLWPLIFVAVPTLISSICYVKLLFGFKKDMEKAKIEHAQIQQQIAALEAQNAVAAEESISE